MLAAISDIADRLETQPVLPSTSQANQSSIFNVVSQIRHWSSVFVSMFKNVTPSDTLPPHQTGSVTCISSATTATECTPSLQHTATTPSLQHTATTPSFQHTATTPSLQHTATTPSLQHTATTPSLQHTATTPSLQHTATTPSLQNTATTPSLQNTATTPSHSIQDPHTIAIFNKYSRVGQSTEVWLNCLYIPRQVETLDDVRVVWEVPRGSCLPLAEWTQKMRNHKPPGKPSNSSIYSQRKQLYKIFKDNNFDEDKVKTIYHETKPGKLYKLLYSKKEK